MKEEWKVYIKGVPGRGDEVIKALTDLGAKGSFYTTSGSNEKFIHFINHKGETDYVCLDTEQAQIIMDNYREIKLPEWKDGDILIKNDGTCYKIFSEYVYHDITSFYAYNIPISVNGTITDYKVGVWVCDIKDYRLATPSEVEHFYKLLHASNKDWDAEKKEIVDWKWKPKKGEKCWLVDYYGDINSLTWNDGFVEKKILDFGNYFQTKEEAEFAAEKIKNLLKGEQL